MKKKMCTAFTLMVMLVFLASCFEKKDPGLLKTKTTSVTATVEAINLAERTVTLKESTGAVKTINVSEDVKSLEKLKVGDHVITVHQKAVAVRMALSNDLDISHTVVETSGDEADKPAASRVKIKKMTATVVGKNVPGQTVTLLGPDGQSKEVSVDDPENLNKVKLGDKIHITYADTYAISVVVEDGRE